MSLGEQLWGYGGGDPYEDNGNFPGLRFNPAPGVPQAVSDLVEDLNRAQKNITSASETLHNIGDGDWTGTAAEAFRAKTRALPKLLDDAGKSFELAHGVLQKWQNQLGAMQSKAHAYEAEAKTARKRAERAEGNEDLQIFRDGGIGMTDAEAEEANKRYTAAINELGAAREELAGIISSAQSIRSQHEELAGTVATVLKVAGEQAPKEPGFFDDLLSGLQKLVKARELILNELGRWVKEHANAIAAIGDVLSTISTVTGVIGLVLDGAFPPAGAAMGLVSGITSGAALGLHGIARAHGADVGDRTLAEDGLGLVSFGVGKAGEKLEKLSEYESAGKMVQNVGKIIGIGSSTMTGEDWLKDPSGLGIFLPQNVGEGVALGGTMLLGGPLGPAVGLGMAFTHAWEAGSKKDAEVHKASH
ncbi:putative T7SS-secreted protein [Streptomyces noursei]|uniref:putative T7SS-secreted protein n=1 Tax=Streptomyces noursei TaxID=1971 RepID=UPI00382C3A9F